MTKQSSHSRWKMSKGESFAHKLTKPRTFHKVTRAETSIIFCMILVAGFFAVSFGYYEGIYLPSALQPTGDPFTTIWDGRTTTGVSPPALSNNIRIDGNTCTGNNIVTSGNFAVSAGDEIIISIAEGGTAGINTVSDTASNSYASQLDISGVGVGGVTQRAHVYAATAATSATITITVTFAGTDYCEIDVGAWSGVTGIGVQSTFVSGAPGNTGSDTRTITTTAISSFIVEGLGTLNGVNSACYNTTYDSGQTNIYTLTCYNATFISHGGRFGYSTSASQGSHSYQMSWTGGTPTNGQAMTHYVLELKSVNNLPCAPGYSCFNAYNNAAGSIVLTPNATTPGIALSQSTVDLSTIVSKEMSLSEEVALSGGSGPYAVFLTLNSTLPQTRNYSPLTDNNTNLVVIFYRNGGTNTFYVYMSRTQHQNLLAADGRSENPGTTRCISQVIFLCGKSITGSGTALSFSLVANYTARAEGNANSARSYLCISNTTGSSCDVGGNAAGTTTVTISPASFGTTTTLPWLNLQQQYYVGFWRAPESGNVTTSWHNVKNDNTCPACNIISLYVPASSSTVPGNVQEGGYFGWLGRTVGGAFAQTGNFLGQAFAPILNVGGSLLSVFISGLVQGFSLMIQFYRTVLNMIGSFFGLGNLGDLLFNTLVAIGQFIVNGFSAIINFFVAIGVLIVSGYFTFLAGFALLVGALLPLALVLWNIIFSGAFTVTDIVFFDYMLGMFLVFKAVEEHRSALKAFLGWISLNVFIVTFLFNAGWTIFDIVTRPIHRVKQTADPVG